MKRRPRAAVRRRVIKCPRRRAGRSGRAISEFPAAACRKRKIPAQSCGRRPFSLHKTVQPPQNHANLLIFRARAAPPPATTPLPDPRARNPLLRKGFSPSEPPEFRRRATKPLPGNAAALCAARKINFPKGIRYPPNRTISSVFRREPLPNQQVLQLLTRLRILPATAGRTRFCGKSPPERWKFMKGE